jgi:hypothetical protein
MMSLRLRYLCCLALSSCVFDPSTKFNGTGEPGAGALDGGNADAMVPFDADPLAPDADPLGPDAKLPDVLAAPVCDSQLTELVACYQFEDGAGAFATGVNGAALQGSISLDAPVADSPSLDVATALTIEAWIRPDGSVTSGRQGLFDNQGQYGFFIVAQDALRCTASSHASASANGVIKVGEWQHVACTYDGSALRVWHNGMMVGETLGSGGITTSGTTGAVIAGDSPSGDEFLGRVDNLRIWSTAQKVPELCAGAGILCPTP